MRPWARWHCAGTLRACAHWCPNGQGSGDCRALTPRAGVPSVRARSWHRPRLSRRAGRAVDLPSGARGGGAPPGPSPTPERPRAPEQCRHAWQTRPGRSAWRKRASEPSREFGSPRKRRQLPDGGSSPVCTAGEGAPSTRPGARSLAPARSACPSLTDRTAYRSHFSQRTSQRPPFPPVCPSSRASARHAPAAA